MPTGPLLARENHDASGDGRPRSRWRSGGAGALETIVQEILANSPKQLEQYKSGKAGLEGYFVGQVMKATKGQANPQVVQAVMAKLLPPMDEGASIVNSIVWDHIDEIGGAASNLQARYTASEGAFGTVDDNVVLIGSPFDIGVGGEYFIFQTPASQTRDAGLDSEASSYSTYTGTSWTTLTTSALGTPDAPPVDLGVHYE